MHAQDSVQMVQALSTNEVENLPRAGLKCGQVLATIVVVASGSFM